MRKLSLLVFLTVICPLCAAAEIKPSDAALTGIVNLPEYKRATLVLSNKNFQSPPFETWIMKEGEIREQFEMLEINPVTGMAKMKWNQTNFDLHLDPPGETRSAQPDHATPNPAIELQNMHLISLLKLYGQLAGRTVLHPTLPDISFTLKASPANQAETASVLANALKQRGITTILDGEKFVQVMPESWVEKAKMRSAQIKAMRVAFPQTKLPSAGTIKPETLIHAGDINMPAVSLQQVIVVYQVLVGAKGIEADAEYSHLPSSAISLISQTPLSRDEAIYAFDTLFSWHGIKIMPSTNNMAKVVKLP